MSWETVCTLNDIVVNSGRAALINGEQVAIFRLKDADGEKLFALSNFDPFSQANVLSRGILGSLEGKAVVAAPIYKQHFCLETGQCLEDESVTLKTWKVKLDGESIILDTASQVQAA